MIQALVIIALGFGWIILGVILIQRRDEARRKQETDAASPPPPLNEQAIRAAAAAMVSHGSLVLRLDKMSEAEQQARLQEATVVVVASLAGRDPARALSDYHSGAGWGWMSPRRQNEYRLLAKVGVDTYHRRVAEIIDDYNQLLTKGTT